MLPCRQGPRYNPAAGHEAISEVAVVVPMAPEQAMPNRGRNMQYLLLGAAAALSAQYAVQWLGHTPWWQRVSRKLWWRPDTPPRSPYGSYAGIPSHFHVAILWESFAQRRFYTPTCDSYIRAGCFHDAPLFTGIHAALALESFLSHSERF